MKTHFFCILAVLAVVVIGAQQAHAGLYYDAVMADGPLGYWQFEETEGLAVDSSGFERNGTYELGVIPGVAAGVPAIGGTAADFDGTSGYVSLPGTWGGTAEATLEAWINSVEPDPNVIQQMIAGHDPNTFAHFQVFSGGVSGFYVDVGPAWVPLDLPLAMPTSVWRHFVMTGKSGESKLYVDGAEFSTNTQVFDLITESSNVDISRGHVNTRWFNGLIDEVAIYDTALSAERIQAHYIAGIPEPGTLLLLLSGLVGLWIWRRRM